MSILLIAPDRDLDGLAAQLAQQAPELEIERWRVDVPCGRPDFALCWNPPPGVLGRIPTLKAVTSLGAGVDALLDPGIVPAHLPIGRISGPKLALDMARWLVAQVMSHWLQLERLVRQQEQARWSPQAPSREPVVGVLGMGHLGRVCAEQFRHLGLQVAGWSRAGSGPGVVAMHRGQDGLYALAERSDYLICLLPLTEQTRGILDHRLFDAMKPGSVLINVGRGQHLVEADLLESLSEDRLALAVLDVFEREPLPADHPFWSHPRIRVSPHCAALSRDEEVASLLIESYRRVQAGLPPLGCIDRGRGY
jgi:glyoxylate/hydroxypyruvate reductase A